MTDSPNTNWKDLLAKEINPDWGQEIDVFEQQMELRKLGKISEPVFAETRLRRGVYGQRYDNGKRHDGIESKTLDYPRPELLKGPNTVWDAPGMIRIKIPYGELTVEQMNALADLSEEYSDGITHITTRQDVQFHYLHIDDAPDLMRRLAAVGITTREACGNVVRNVTACPFAGVCQGEAFDVTPYAHALTFFLMGHPDTQDFGRKVKIAFSGCATNPCGLTTFHDIGLIAKVEEVDGIQTRGFAYYVGGGLGSVPSQAKLLEEFVPEYELLPLSQAVCRVFARLGEKNNRTRARMKFLVNKVGIEEFRRLVAEERQILPHDERWIADIDATRSMTSKPLLPESIFNLDIAPESFKVWFQSNVRPQRQRGYATVTVACPLGDLSALQMRGIADIAKEFVGDNIRLTVEQNLVFRWVPENKIVALWQALDELSLGDPTAGTIVDVTACPGTDTCKLGHASSRGLAATLRDQLTVTNAHLDTAIKDLRVKVSGCFNSCGQHHVADIGFYGVGRKVKGFMVPHFQVVVGGQWNNNGGAYGLAIGAVPSKSIPEALSILTNEFANNRLPEEGFREYVQRVGKPTIKASLKEVMTVPSHDEDPSFYHDWLDPREYTTGDLGVGECAGENVSAAEFGLSDSERKSFDAQTLLDSGNPVEASQKAFDAMIQAAHALLRTETSDVPLESEAVLTEFKTRFFDTKRFFDPYAGGKFANYLYRQAKEQDVEVNHEIAHHRIEEAQLFIEAAYNCYARLGAA